MIAQKICKQITENITKITDLQNIYYTDLFIFIYYLSYIFRSKHTFKLFEFLFGLLSLINHSLYDNDKTRL